MKSRTTPVMRLQFADPPLMGVPASLPPVVMAGPSAYPPSSVGTKFDGSATDPSPVTPGECDWASPNEKLVPESADEPDVASITETSSPLPASETSPVESNAAGAFDPHETVAGRVTPRAPTHRRKTLPETDCVPTT